MHGLRRTRRRCPCEDTGSTASLAVQHYPMAEVSAYNESYEAAMHLCAIHAEHPVLRLRL